jgi:hypothetical protein
VQDPRWSLTPSWPIWSLRASPQALDGHETTSPVPLIHWWLTMPDRPPFRVYFCPRCSYPNQGLPYRLACQQLGLKLVRLALLSLPLGAIHEHTSMRKVELFHCINCHGMAAVVPDCACENPPGSTPARLRPGRPGPRQDQSDKSEGPPPGSGSPSAPLTARSVSGGHPQPLRRVSGAGIK